MRAQADALSKLERRVEDQDAEIRALKERMGLREEESMYHATQDELNQRIWDGLLAV